MAAGDERRNQVRVPLQLQASRARRWVAGAWRDLAATVVDLSSRGLGLTLDHEVAVGDRVSLTMALDQFELRTTVEIRHVRADARSGVWRAGGQFRNLPTADHDEVIRFISQRLQAKQG
jgi:c-di-GMP-binding flagellar brake protein YcgR